MTRSAGWATAVVLLLSVAAPVAAQESAIARGARIRVFAPTLGARPVVGIHDTLTAGVLAWRSSRSDSLEHIRLSQLTRLEVSAGRNTRRGRIVGAVTGFGAMLAGGFLCLAICPTDPDDGANLAPVGGLIYGLVIGAPVGALLGGSKFAPERWRQIPLARSSARTPTPPATPASAASRIAPEAP